MRSKGRDVSSSDAARRGMDRGGLGEKRDRNGANLANRAIPDASALRLCAPRVRSFPHLCSNKSILTARSTLWDGDRRHY